MNTSTPASRIAKFSIAAIALLALAGSASAQAPAATDATKASNKAVVRPSGNPARDNLLKLQTVISIDQANTRLGNVIEFIQKETGANFEPLWKGDRSEGLDKDAEISVSYKDLPAIVVLEKVLTKYGNESGSECAWQMSDVGAVQMGPKAVLNKIRRLEMYDINDLLIVVHIYDQAPEIDLEKVLQGGGRGGGGGGGGTQGSPFRQNQQNNKDNQKEKEKEREDRAKEIIGLITSTIETNQWFGDVPEPRYFRGSIIVDAPDYIHRALVGYKYWPSEVRPVSGGKRYVTMTTDNQINKIKGVENQPITGTTGGGAGGTPPPGGGG